jgi:hypothetical protein
MSEASKVIPLSLEQEKERQKLAWNSEVSR